MGIIKLFKELTAFAKLLKELPQEIERQQEAYLKLSTQELAELPDEDLFVAARLRLEATADACEEVSEGFSKLNDHQKVVYAVNYLEMEVNNGGLCQFFVNSSRALAPYISDYLGIIGAQEHKALFDGFISANQIDLSDLSSFAIQRSRDFEKMAKRYPFDDYDDKFYELPSLEEPLTQYIRSHIESF